MKPTPIAAPVDEQPDEAQVGHEKTFSALIAPVPLAITVTASSVTRNRLRAKSRRRRESSAYKPVLPLLPGLRARFWRQPQQADGQIRRHRRRR